MEIKNAIIENWHISTADYGCLSMWLYLDYGGISQGFGGFNLGRRDSLFRSDGGNYCGHFISKVMEVAGVEDLSQLKGRPIRVECDDRGVSSIGHIIKEIWFNPTKEFKNKE